MKMLRPFEVPYPQTSSRETEAAYCQSDPTHTRMLPACMPKAKPLSVTKHRCTCFSFLHISAFIWILAPYDGGPPGRLDGTTEWRPCLNLHARTSARSPNEDIRAAAAVADALADVAIAATQVRRGWMVQALRLQRTRRGRFRGRGLIPQAPARRHQRARAFAQHFDGVRVFEDAGCKEAFQRAKPRASSRFIHLLA